MICFNTLGLRIFHFFQTLNLDCEAKHPLLAFVFLIIDSHVGAAIAISDHVGSGSHAWC